MKQFIRVLKLSKNYDYENLKKEKRKKKCALFLRSYLFPLWKPKKKKNCIYSPIYNLERENWLVKQPIEILIENVVPKKMKKKIINTFSRCDSSFWMWFQTNKQTKLK